MYLPRSCQPQHYQLHPTLSDRLARAVQLNLGNNKMLQIPSVGGSHSKHNPLILLTVLLHVKCTDGQIFQELLDFLGHDTLPVVQAPHRSFMLGTYPGHM